MIKVLRIINRFNLGGPTYNATYLSAFLSEEFETRLVGGTHEEHEGASLFIPEKYGQKVEIIESLQRSVNYQSDKQALKEIRALIREFRPDIVHTHASKAGALGRTAAYKEKVPVIVHTFHGHVFHSYFGSLKTLFYKSVERRLAKKSDAIIAISPLQKKELTEDHRICSKEKVRVIPLGFDLERFQEDRDERRRAFRAAYKLEEETVVFSIVGRLTAIKNHKWFFDAVRELSLNSPANVRIFVVGDGEMRTELEEYAMKIEKEVGKELFVFTSWIKNIEEVLPAFDVITLSSLNEGTPVSLIEAQAAGVPVLTTDVGGVRDVVLDEETGFIVSLNEQQSYVAKMKLLAEDKELRQKMSQNGWNHVKDKFHYRRLCQDVEKLYVELLKKKKIGS